MEAMQVARRSTEDLATNPLFSRSLAPMLLLDDERRYVDANAAACLFLRRPIEALRKLRIDDLTAPEARRGMQAMWSLLLQGRSARESLLRDIRMPDGTSVAIEFSVTPQIQPGRHLASVKFSAAHAHEGCFIGAAPPAKNVLTARERQVLTLVALGNTGVEIAKRLFLSPATVQTHVANALIKLEAKNRSHGVALAIQANEIDLATALLRH